MVSGISGAINTAKDALLANLAAISVTGSNISNLNTTGYTRLRPVFTPTGVGSSSSNAAAQISVRMSEAERVYDLYLDEQIITQKSNVGYQDTRKTVLDRIETILNESTGGGISEYLGNFWDSWTSLSLNPDGLVERQSLLDASQTLVSTINQRAESLESIRQDVNYDVKSSVDKINEYLTQIGDFNGRIFISEFGGGSASDLRDQRNVALQELSKLTQVNFFEDKTGQVNVYFPDGKSLVSGTTTSLLDVKLNSTNRSFYDIVYKGTTQVINSSITGGGIYGLLEMRDTTIPGYIDSLDSLTTRLVDTVNTQHALGFDANGNVGGDFFKITNVVSPYIEIDPPIVPGTNTYAGTATSGGTYTGDSAKNYLVQIVAGGALAAATYRISTDGGATWGTTSAAGAMAGGTINLVDPGPPSIDEGATLSFTAGTFAANDQFVVKVHSSASKLQMNITDTQKIAASSTVNGDGLNAKEISLLGEDTTVMKGSATMGEYYQAFIGKMGQDVANAGSNSTHQTMLLTQMQNQREQISGVSLDEEMLNLTKFQNGYAAAARLSSVVNELMDILMNYGR